MMGKISRKRPGEPGRFLAKAPVKMPGEQIFSTNDLREIL